MAKSSKINIKLVSTEGSGYFYVTSKNPKKQPEKLQFRKYDAKLRKHVMFKEEKLK